MVGHLSLSISALEDRMRKVLIAPGVYLLDQPVQRRHMAIMDSPPLVCDDYREAARLRQRSRGSVLTPTG